MKLEFILNIFKAILKVQGLSKAVIMMGDLWGSFLSSWDLQVFRLDSSEHKNNWDWDGIWYYYIIGGFVTISKIFRPKYISTKTSGDLVTE